MIQHLGAMGSTIAVAVYKYGCLLLSIMIVLWTWKRQKQREVSWKTALFAKRLFCAAWELLLRTDILHNPFRQRDNLLYDTDANHYDHGVPSGPLDWICSQKPLNMQGKCKFCTFFSKSLKSLGQLLNRAC
jgi:hypothetical protein